MTRSGSIKHPLRIDSNLDTETLRSLLDDLRSEEQRMTRNDLIEALVAMTPEERLDLYEEVHFRGFEPYDMFKGMRLTVRLREGIKEPRAAIAMVFMRASYSRDQALSFTRSLQDEGYLTLDVQFSTEQIEMPDHPVLHLDRPWFEVTTEPLKGTRVTEPEYSFVASLMPSAGI